MRGLAGTAITLEVYGHLAPQTKHPDKLYRADMRELVASLGLNEVGE